MKILLLHGPNLNLLGVRDPALYGHQTLPELEAMCEAEAARLGLTLECRQSNHEGELVSWVQQARGTFAALIVNAGAYTHTSLALHDALELFPGPIVEVHLSDPKTRETFRHFSYVELLAVKTIAGKGAAGYVEALGFLANLRQKED